MFPHFTTIKTYLDENGILHVTLDRPEKLNALNEQVIDELGVLIAESRSAHAIKALLLTGSGKAFCAGADIEQLQRLNSVQGYDFARKGQAVFRALEQLGKPSLAAINGYAFGGGCELAMSCSLRIAASTAQFGQPEIKLGIIPGYGGTQRLARLIGKGRAMDLCLTGRSISAEQAFEWGLVTEIVAPEDLLPKAIAILEGITQMAPRAMASILTTIDDGYNMSLDEALRLEASHFGLLCATQDKQEGTAAFLGKRKPKFSGE